jgi:hypothetical protein
MNKPVPVCKGCGGTERVVSVSIQVTCRSIRAMSTTLHLCEGCLLYAPDLAKTSIDIQGGEHTLAESLSDGPKRLINRTLYYIATAAGEAYRNLRGGE